jgi:hypothetical protein
LRLKSLNSCAPAGAQAQAESSRSEEKTINYFVLLSLNRNFEACASKIGGTSEIKINKFYFVFLSVCTIFVIQKQKDNAERPENCVYGNA